MSRQNLDMTGAGGVSTGVWATPIPFPSPLGFSYSYSVRVPAGVVIIDLGWNSDRAWDAFQAGLAESGTGLDDIVGVVATHVHPDHYGLAKRIRDNTSAWLAIHPAERSQIVSGSQREIMAEQLLRWLQLCGAPDDRGLHREAQRLVDTMTPVQPDITLSDGAVVPETGGALAVIHTPGHTAGHLCIYDRSRELLFTGDHVLPRVTPNISKRPGSNADPLDDYIRSLIKVGNWAKDSRLILPGHQWPFDHLDDRVSALVEHHENRLTEICNAVPGDGATVWQIAQLISWSRPFLDFDQRGRRQAMGETLAHLVRLVRAGKLVRTMSPREPGATIWSPVRGGALTTEATVTESI